MFVICRSSTSSMCPSSCASVPLARFFRLGPTLTCVPISLSHAHSHMYRYCCNCVLPSRVALGSRRVLLYTRLVSTCFYLNPHSEPR
jgi:hypothetical protein